MVLCSINLCWGLELRVPLDVGVVVCFKYSYFFFLQVEFSVEVVLSG